MEFEKITEGTIPAMFCPQHTLYSCTQKDSALLQFHTIYWKMIEGFGRPTQWVGGYFLAPFKGGLDNLWWVCHQTNSIYLTTEKQFIYCQLVFGHSLQQAG